MRIENPLQADRVWTLLVCLQAGALWTVTDEVPTVLRAQILRTAGPACSLLGVTRPIASKETCRRWARAQRRVLCVRARLCACVRARFAHNFLTPPHPTPCPPRGGRKVLQLTVVVLVLSLRLCVAGVSSRLCRAATVSSGTLRHVIYLGRFVSVTSYPPPCGQTWPVSVTAV